MVRLLSSSRGPTRSHLAFLTILSLAFAAPARAQEAAELLAGVDLPADARTLLSARLDDPATLRRQGPTRIDAAERIDGTVAVIGGDVTVAGVVDGDLIVIRGNAVFEPRSAVTGDVIVVCGNASNTRAAKLDGGLTIYGPSFCGTRAAAKASTWDDDWRPRPTPQRVREAPGHATIGVRVDGNYSRVEGLPLALGPIVETSGRNPLRLEAFAVIRSDHASGLDRTGYVARLEQFLGGNRELRVGGSLRSTVDAIETHGMSDLEASLASAIFRLDPRDYFLRTGWSAFVRWTPRASPFDLSLEYRDEEHEAVDIANAWSLFDDDEPWRAQPLVAEGDLRSLTARLVFNTRDDDEHPTRGWYLDASVTRALDGSLTLPEHVAVTEFGPGVVPPTPFATDFTTATIDVRRYTRVGYHRLLGLRVLAGGTLADEPLPPQYQHAFGGVSTLPGYQHFAGDCGARSTSVRRGYSLDGRVFFPVYGCDRFALFQAEYIGDIGIDVDLFGHRRDRPSRGEWDEWWDWGLDFEPRWTLFFDAARGWSAGDIAMVPHRDTGTLLDAGAGLLFDDLGVYIAIPLEGGDRKPSVTLRLGRRF